MKQIFHFFVLVMSMTSSRLLACEGCKMASINGFKEVQTIQAGIALSWSVLFLLFILFVLLGILAWAMYTACQQAEAAHHSCSRLRS